MDRYERIIRDVQERTEEDRLLWRLERPAACARILMNPDRVLRVYTADYDLAGSSYRLLFAERRTEFHDDFGEVFEGYGFELFVLGMDGEIVIPLYEGVVDRTDLLRLAALVDEHNDRARDFFAAFDAAEAVSPAR